MTATMETITPVAKLGINLDELYKQALDIQNRCSDSMVTKANSQNIHFDGDSGKLCYTNDLGLTSTRKLTPHAMTQLCSKIGVPTKYVEKCLESGMTDLAAENINSWLSDYNKSLFVREYEDRVRGVLSDRYMALDTPDILSVLSDVVDPSQYSTKGYFLNPERFHARIVQNEMMNIAGEDLFAGIQIDSSDVGRSTLLVRFFVFKQVCTNGLCVSKGGGIMYEQRHIGVNLKEFRNSFVESMKTLPDLVDNYTKLIKSASEDNSDKYRVTVFSKEQMDEFIQRVRANTRLSDESVHKVIDLMTQRYQPNKWGFVNSITEVAQDFTLERRIELEKYAGDLLLVA